MLPLHFIINILFKIIKKSKLNKYFVIVVLITIENDYRKFTDNIV